MTNKINLIIATLYSIALAIVETFLNWGAWQYAPLWIVDYLIVIILLVGVFVCKESQQKVLLLGWSFSAGVMYIALFMYLEPESIIVIANPTLLYAIGLALAVSLVGIVLTMIDN